MTKLRRANYTKDGHVIVQQKEMTRMICFPLNIPIMERVAKQLKIYMRFGDDHVLWEKETHDLSEFWLLVMSDKNYYHCFDAGYVQAFEDLNLYKRLVKNRVHTLWSLGKLPMNHFDEAWDTCGENKYTNGFHGKKSFVETAQLIFDTIIRKNNDHNK